MKISEEEAASPDKVKVVTAANGNALYFSRSPIPYVRKNVGDTQKASPYLGHVGLYAFRMDALRRFTTLPPSQLEQIECLEQLRLLENGISMRVVPTTYKTHGVDRPEDIDVIINLLMENDR